MTFTEAAAHVLRLVGKPLHYKEITDVAIERDLLSHVGKSPEVTMGARLAAVVKKDPKDNPLVRVKPGVFALRDWDQSIIEMGLADRTPALERIAKMEVSQGDDHESEPEVAEGTSPSALAAAEEDAEAGSSYPDLGLDNDEEEDIGEDERERAELAAAATELFVPEEDDDEPILGGGDVEVDSSDRAESVGGKRRRRRRRRGGRGGLDEDNGLPSYTVSDAPLLADTDEEAPARIEGRRAPEARVDLRGEVRGEARSAEAAPSRSAERAPEARVETRSADGGRPERGVEDLSIPSMLALLEQLLPARSRGGSVPLRQLAEQGVRRMRGKIEIQQLQDALADAVRYEVVRARLERRRSRFVMHGRAVACTDWGMDAEVLRLEKELMAAAARHRDAFQRSFGERLQSLPPRAFGDFFTLLLSQLGFENVEPVKRQGIHNQELHLAAVARSATGDVPTAIIVRRDGRDIGRERVIDLRGALHHYGGAMAGLLATTGQVMSGAREEARVPNAAPVTLLDGAALAKLAIQYGVGVASTELRVPMFDVELLDSLTAS